MPAVIALIYIETVPFLYDSDFIIYDIFITFFKEGERSAPAVGAVVEDELLNLGDLIIRDRIKSMFFMTCLSTAASVGFCSGIGDMFFLSDRSLTCRE